jgi:hypothetical protein
MGRPKGSKNKEKEGEVKFTTKSDVTPPVPIQQKPWTPSPDMGNIKPPADAEKICANEHCRHKKGMHYGGKDEWCNTSGCNCQAWCKC